MLILVDNKIYTKNIIENTLNHIDDTVKDGNYTVNGVNDTVNDANDTVLSLILENPKITASDISKRLGISIATAKRRIKVLKEKGMIKRIGSDKAGSWQIVNSENNNAK